MAIAINFGEWSLNSGTMAPKELIKFLGNCTDTGSEDELLGLSAYLSTKMGCEFRRNGMTRRSVRRDHS